MKTLNEPFAKILDEKKREIFKWFKEDYIGSEGMPIFDLDARTGKAISAKNQIAELGDYLPFFSYFKQEEFVNAQLKLVHGFFKKDGILLKRVSIPKKMPFYEALLLKAVPKHAECFEYTDLLLGLLEVYELTKEKKALDLAKTALDKAYSLFYKDGLMYDLYFPQLKLKIPLSSSLSGMYIELLCDFYRLTKDERYLKRAKALAGSWINLPFVKKYGLFPAYCSPGALTQKIPIVAKYSNVVKIHKHNTSMMAGIVALYNQTHDKDLLTVIGRWVNGVQKYLMQKEGGITEVVKFNKGNPTTLWKIELRNFAVIDLLCDISHFTNNQKYLALACRIADFWLNLQSGKTGLIPFESGGKESRFDPLTDFSIALMKLHELTGKTKYKVAAVKIFQGQLKYHWTNRGYVERVDVNSGKITDYRIETRFTSLFLKSLLLFSENKKIYEDWIIYSIMRDR